MKVLSTKNFNKKFKKLKTKEKDKFDERLEIFIEAPTAPILNNHQLKGSMKGSFSINITGDLRAIYSFKDKDIIVFIDIDTHSNLYR